MSNLIIFITLPEGRKLNYWKGVHLLNSIIVRRTNYEDTECD